MRCIRVAVTNDRVLHHDESPRMIPKSGVRFSDQDHAPLKKGGEAPKDACHPVSAPFLPEGRGCGSDPSQTSLRSLRNLSAWGPLAFRRSAAALARTQPRPRFTRNTMRRRYLRLESCLSEAPRTPVVMPEGIAVCIGANCVNLFALPGPPGSGVTSPARTNRTRSVNWLSPVDVPDVSETARLSSSPRQSQRLCICADESAPSRGAFF
jgi:hypothetical protein